MPCVTPSEVQLRQPAGPQQARHASLPGVQRNGADQDRRAPVQGATRQGAATDPAPASHGGMASRRQHLVHPGAGVCGTPAVEPNPGTAGLQGEVLPQQRSEVRSAEDHVPAGGQGIKRSGSKFCGHGFQIGPGVGLCLSELIVDGATQTPLEPFSIGRFRTPAAVSEKFLKEFDRPGDTASKRSPETVTTIGQG